MNPARFSAAMSLRPETTGRRGILYFYRGPQGLDRSVGDVLDAETLDVQDYGFPDIGLRLLQSAPLRCDIQFGTASDEPFALRYD